MTVGRICTREVDVADPQESVKTAAERMSERNVGSLVVQNPAGEPIGMLTDRDIVVRLVAGRMFDLKRTRVEDVMTVSPKVVSEKTSIEDALAVMRSGGFRRLPVVGREGKLLGIVSLDDVMELLANEIADVGKLLSSQSVHRGSPSPI